MTFEAIIVKEKLKWLQQGTKSVPSTALNDGEFISFSHSRADVIGTEVIGAVALLAGKSRE